MKLESSFSATRERSQKNIVIEKKIGLVNLKCHPPGHYDHPRARNMQQQQHHRQQQHQEIDSQNIMNVVFSFTKADEHPQKMLICSCNKRTFTSKPDETRDARGRETHDAV